MTYSLKEQLEILRRSGLSIKQQTLADCKRKSIGFIRFSKKSGRGNKQAADDCDLYLFKVGFLLKEYGVHPEVIRKSLDEVEYLLRDRFKGYSKGLDQKWFLNLVKHGEEFKMTTSLSRDLEYQAMLSIDLKRVFESLNK